MMCLSRHGFVSIHLYSMKVVQPGIDSGNLI
jgi:hypothetical protein